MIDFRRFLLDTFSEDIAFTRDFSIMSLFWSFSSIKDCKGYTFDVKNIFFSPTVASLQSKIFQKKNFLHKILPEYDKLDELREN